MGTPHMHAAVIKAWADGAEIQVLQAGGVWVDFKNYTPTWNPDKEYRVKPQPVKSGGYKRYLSWCMGKPAVFTVHEKSIGTGCAWDPAFIASNNYFIRWIDTEWQYETVEVE